MNVIIVDKTLNDNSLLLVCEGLNFEKVTLFNDYFTYLFIETKDSDNDDSNFAHTEFTELFHKEIIDSTLKKLKSISKISIFSTSKFLLPTLLDIPPPLW